MDRPLKKPLTARQIRLNLDKEGYITGVVEIDLPEVIRRDFDEFLDLISEKLVGSSLLEDISYRIVGHTAEAIHLEVTGDPRDAIEFAKPSGVLDWDPDEPGEEG